MPRKHRRNNRKKNKYRNRNRNRTQKKKVFNINDFVCIRKQKEGVGIVNKEGDKGSYLIEFKNGKWAWYRSTKISLITEDEYNIAPSGFIIDPTLPSPSPTPSPSPIPTDNSNNSNDDDHDDYKLNKNIKFTKSIQNNNDVGRQGSDQNNTIKIQIEDVKDPPISDIISDLISNVISNVVSDVINDTVAINTSNASIPSKHDTVDDLSKMEENENKHNDYKDHLNDDIPPVTPQPSSNNIKQKRNKNNKSKLIKKKDKIQKIQKIKLSKIEKKMKLYYKVKDLRERAFMIMCDENKMIDKNSLFEYIQHFGNKPSKVSVKQFLNFMKPNANGVVSFSKFVKAIDDDGDVIAAFNRFKKSGNARSKK